MSVEAPNQIKPTRSAVIPKSGPPYAFERTRQFLIAAIKEGAFLIPEEQRETFRGSFLVRQNNILGSYYMSGATLEDLALIYGKYTKRGRVTREAIRQTIEKGMRRVWNSSALLQEQFSWEDILLHKPESLRTREKKSRAGGGSSVQIKQQLEAGVTSLDEIAQNTGITKRAMRNPRRILRNWGFTLPREVIWYSEVEKKIEEEEDNEKLQELLDSLPAISLISHMQHTRNPQSQFVSLGVLLHQAGFRFRALGVFGEALRNAHIPVRMANRNVQRRRNEKEYPLNYWVTLTKRKDDILEVINGTPEPAL